MSDFQKRKIVWITPLLIFITLFFPQLPHYIQLSGAVIMLIIFIIQYISAKKRNRLKVPNYVYLSTFFTAICIILYILGKNYFSLNEDILMGYLIAPGVLVSLFALFILAISLYKKGNNEQRKIAKLVIIIFILSFISCFIIFLNIVNMNQ